MPHSLARLLRLTPRERSNIGGVLGRFKKVSEFLAEALPQAGRSGLAHAVGEAVPWADAVLQAGEAFAPIKFAVRLFASLAEVRDPGQLAFLACTLAYERSIEQAVEALGLAAVKHELDDRLLAARLAAAAHEQGSGAAGTADAGAFDLNHFALGNALLHPFVLDCDRLLEAYAEAAGYSAQQRRALLNEVHQRFVGNLKTLISHGSTHERFVPLLRRMSLGTGDALIAEALADHAELQRWLFEERPVFGKEPFSLAQVYVDTDCGQLTWGQLHGDPEPVAADLPPRQDAEHRGLDPFAERNGGRLPLGRAVLALMGDPRCKDAIVIQGTAGAGKSAFTLWLAAELIRQGLRPIRVLLKQVGLADDLSLGESLTRGIQLTDEGYRPARPPSPRPDSLLEAQVLNQKIRFGEMDICPYVLILDGWDEISLSVEQTFKQRVGRLLERIRASYLGNREVPIRVILTGRPSTTLSESAFLLKRTPILTLRPLRPAQVEDYIARVASLLQQPGRSLVGTGWQRFDADRLRPALAVYREDFERRRDPRAIVAHAEPPASTGRLDVLGLPLLLHLALRLLSDARVAVDAVVATPTALLRSLVDLTCSRSGKAEGADDEIEQQYRIAGRRLRELLRWTAAAVTVTGREAISFEELRLRLKAQHIELVERVEHDTKLNDLTALMVSYYFKGGRRELGCEFLHKSFREYLFAECVVEMLKDYGRAGGGELPERAVYEDFPARDPRRRLNSTLCRWLSPVTLSPEVAVHLEQLLSWEMARVRPASAVVSKTTGFPEALAEAATGTVAAPEGSEVGQPTEPLQVSGWLCVRDALADLWDAWAEGFHLRPSVGWDDLENLVVSPAPVHALAEWKIRRDVARGGYLPETSRYIVSDSNLGDALLRLAACVHFQLAVMQGWLTGKAAPRELWHQVTPPGQGPRRCQCGVAGAADVRLFSPAGSSSPYYFEHLASRVNAAGWRRWPFPLGCDLRGIDLRGVRLMLTGDAMVSTRWDYSNLAGASAAGCVFRGHQLWGIHAPECDFARADLADAVLAHADLTAAKLAGAVLSGAVLYSANLHGANLGRAHLGRAQLDRANLTQAKLGHAWLSMANLRAANLTAADLGSASFLLASLVGADLTGADLSGAELIGADLEHCSWRRPPIIRWKAALLGALSVPQEVLAMNQDAAQSPLDESQLQRRVLRRADEAPGEGNG